MNKIHRSLLIRIFLLLSLLPVASCVTNHSNDSYVKQIRNWHQKRIERLKAADSWLSLAGLYWLKEGANTFGSAPQNDMVFPAGKAPAYIGKIILHQGATSAVIADSVAVTVNGKTEKRITLKNDQQGQPTVMRLGSLSWYVIKRGAQYGLRLKDSENPTLIQFKGIECFPVRRAWRIKAVFRPFPKARTVAVPTVLGTVVNEAAPGVLEFEHQGARYRLVVLADESDPQFFTIFADSTNGRQTYHAGRFLVIDKPGRNGVTYIDFNKAYNPPCAFTPYATCPLPPKENYLPFAVTAGEKDYGQHDTNRP